MPESGTASQHAILILNGPNLNRVGQRQPEHYGSEPFAEALPRWQAAFPALALSLEQSNHEGALVDWVQRWPAYSGLIINAGAYAHTSIALYDALLQAAIPVVEVHLSNIFARESFRHTSYLAPACAGVISGFGMAGYQMALGWLRDQLVPAP
jgi:3-dehydroquinate dehydratase-2